MICPKCGTHNLEDTLQCASCGAPLSPPGPAVPFTPAAIEPDAHPELTPNYLMPSILATVFCCMPTGIAALVFASQVNTKLALGDAAGAMQSAKNAKLWCLVSLTVGLVMWGALLAGVIVTSLFGMLH